MGGIIVVVNPSDVFSAVFMSWSTSNGKTTYNFLRNSENTHNLLKDQIFRVRAFSRTHKKDWAEGTIVAYSTKTILQFRENFLFRNIGYKIVTGISCSKVSPSFEIRSSQKLYVKSEKRLIQFNVQLFL